MNYDALAIDIFLDPKLSRKQKDAKLAHVATKARKEMNNEVECPDCGDEGPHDDNGLTGYRKAFCCRACGMHFDAHPEQV